MRCITSEKGLKLLKEIHSGFYCSHRHKGSNRKRNKARILLAYHKKLVLECEACQKTANQQNLPTMPVNLIPPSWSLQRWGMDLVGPLPTAQGNCKFTAVAVDYFTKCVDEKALANITAPRI
jgi:hypothetical protein